MKKRMIAEVLSEIEFPGDGIIAGKTEDGDGVITACFVCSDEMNRRFVEEGGGVAIEPMDNNADPALVYQPALTFENKVLLCNASHGEQIFSSLAEGKSFGNAVKDQKPLADGNARLTALLNIGEHDFEMDLRITKYAGEGEGLLKQSFKYSDLPKGTGYILCSHRSKDTSFEGEPICVSLEGSIFDMVADIWENLHAKTRLSLWVRWVDLNTHRDIQRIINRVR